MGNMTSHVNLRAVEFVSNGLGNQSLTCLQGKEFAFGPSFPHITANTIHLYIIVR